MKNRLYLVLHPHTVLVASQLDPPQFASHYMSGSSRHYTGKLIYAELKHTFRHPFFPIGEVMQNMKPHSDGRPKATKFIKTYRVLEHIDLSQVLHAYLANANGTCLELDKGELYAPIAGSVGEIHFFAEICPMKMLAISQLNYKTFGQYRTNPRHTKGAPAICYTQIRCDADALLSDESYAKHLKTNLFPSANIEKLQRAIRVLKERKDKETKGILLETDFTHISYKYLEHGIVLCNSDQMVIFTMPSLEDIETTNPEFFASL